jgi:hypothetical protein
MGNFIGKSCLSFFTVSKGKLALGIGGVAAALIALGLVWTSQQPATSSDVETPSLLDTSQTPVVANSSLAASIEILNPQIIRGSIQTIRVVVTDEDGSITGATVNVVVYYDGEIARSFNGVTDEDGYYTIDWLIGSSSNPGAFNVVAEVSYFSERTRASGTFVVTGD